MLPQRLAFVDLETTGGSLKRDRVIEIGILRIEEGKLVKTYKSLIDPGTRVPPEIERLTGITSKDLEGAPTFYQIKDEITEILKDCVFVAHNVRFDYSFLKNEFKRYNIKFSPKHFCTVKLSRHLFPGEKRHNLDAVMERFGIKCENRHRAFDDAQVLWEFYQKITNSFSLETIKAAIDLGLKRPTVPVNLSKEDIDKLPESPGVYIFYGPEGMPLYIGKSINLKKRVMQHFSSDHLSSTEMKIAGQVQQIETIPTVGELGALIKESDLIKKMQPLYNRKLRNLKQLVVLKKVENPAGYLTVKLEHADNIDTTDLENVLGLFRNKRQATSHLIHLAEEIGLCEKLLGVDNSSSACFGYRLDRCKGACSEQESPASYNVRFVQAFTKTKLKPWPYEKPILIEEEDSGKKESFLIDKWCFLGSLKTEDDTENVEYSHDVRFDLDIYKIIERFLRTGTNLTVKDCNLASVPLSNQL